MWLLYTGGWAFVSTLSWTTAAVYFIRDVEMSPLELVLAGTALELAYFLFEVPTGVVADLYSRRTSLVISAGVVGAGMLLIAAVPHFATVLVGMAVWGFGWTFRSGAEDAWLADEVGPHDLGAAYQRGAQVRRVLALLGIGAAVALALVDLRLPFAVSGVVVLGFAGVIAVAMPERNFTPPERAPELHWLGSGLGQARRGFSTVRGHPVLVLVLLVAVFSGAWAEGFDRLHEALFLNEVGLPRIGGLDSLVWFGIFAAGALVLSFVVAAPLVERSEALDQAGLARLLLALHAVLMVTAVTFALAGLLWLAIAAYWATSVARDLVDAPYRTWLNNAVTDSRTRATVLSVVNIGGSGGEWVGGPALGLVGNVWGLRAALTAGGLLLAPTLVLLGRSVRRRGRT